MTCDPIRDRQEGATPPVVLDESPGINVSSGLHELFRGELTEGTRVTLTNGRGQWTRYRVMLTVLGPMFAVEDRA